jgi:hemolysin activation/secretion protein
VPRPLVLLTGFVLGLAAPALALASTSVPPSAQSERMGQDNSLTGLKPLPSEPAPSNPATPLLSRPAGAQTMQLTITAVQLEGRRALEEAALNPYWQELIGKPITLATLYELCDTITRHYRNAGYILAQASLPPQELGDGPVRITINEGQIGTVTYEGVFAESPVIQKTLNRLRQLSVFHLPQVEREILLLDDLPGAEFKLVLQPGVAASVNITVVGTRSTRLSGRVQIENSGSRYLGPYIAGGSLTVTNLFGGLQQTTLALTSALQLRELTGVSLAHTLPLGRPELQLITELQATRGEPGYTLAANDIDSRSWQADIHADYALLRQRSATLIVSAGLQLREATTDLAGSRLSQDSARSAYIAARYDWGDKLGGQSLFRAEVSKGLGSWLGGSAAGDSNLSRDAARPSHTRLDLTLLRQQPLGQNFQLFGMLRGQFSDAPLLAGDEFSYGGSFIGRAYDSSEMVGDSGISALAELRTRPLEAKQLQLQPFVFADYGVVWNRDAGQPARDEGASAGLGVQATYKGAEGRLTLAQPLQESRASTYANNPGPRLLFNLQAQF